MEPGRWGWAANTILVNNDGFANVGHAYINTTTNSTSIFNIPFTGLSMSKGRGIQLVYSTYPLQ